MGTTAHLVVTGVASSGADDDGVRSEPATELLDRARGWLADIEQRWSRFRPDSELSRLNASPGAPVMVSQDTFDVIALAVDAWRLTAGRFDPTVLDAVVAAGYDRTFDEVRVRAAGSPVDPVDSAGATPGCERIVLDRALAAVTLPAGVHLDLGGVGKGRAADVVAERLVAEGAAGACVNLGGDVRVSGSGPDDGTWIVGIEHPLEAGTDVAVVALAAGAVATSARTNRHWASTDGEAHHLIDPTNGLPASTGLAAVTVVAADAAWAEILAKAAFVAGPTEGVALVVDADAAGMFVADDGTVVRTPGFERFEA